MTVDYGDNTGVRQLPVSSAGVFALDHFYTQPGTFTVIVNLSDSRGVISTAKLGVTATAGPALVSGFGKRRDVFVETLYRENLGTLPDLGTLKSLSRRLAVRARPRRLALSIWGSSEHQRLLNEGLLSPVKFRRTLVNAVRAARHAVKFHQPPAHSLTLTVISQSS